MRTGNWNRSLLTVPEWHSFMSLREKVDCIEVITNVWNWRVRHFMQWKFYVREFLTCNRKIVGRCLVLLSTLLLIVMVLLRTTTLNFFRKKVACMYVYLYQFELWLVWLVVIQCRIIHEMSSMCLSIKKFMYFYLSHADKKIHL